MLGRLDRAVEEDLGQTQSLDGRKQYPAQPQEAPRGGQHPGGRPSVAALGEHHALQAGSRQGQLSQHWQPRLRDDSYSTGSGSPQNPSSISPAEVWAWTWPRGQQAGGGEEGHSLARVTQVLEEASLVLHGSPPGCGVLN